MHKVFLRTFGCQMNVHDSGLIKTDLLRAGYEITEKASQADIILFNTCAVREHAEDRVQSHIGALRKYLDKKPNLIVGLMGCIAQHLGKHWASKYPYLKLIIGTHQLHRVPAIIEEHLATGKKIIETEENYDVKFDRSFECEGSDFAATIAVMRGCDHACSYCIVPRVRGKEVHRNFDGIIEEAKKLVDAGFKQITLLGQNIDSYGRKLKPRRSLAELLLEIDKLYDSGLRRTFFITSHPSDLREDLFHALKEGKTLGRYLHLPAQSGSNGILKSMKRGYTSERYLEILETGRSIVPDLEFAGDWIVGYPGETDEDFIATKDLLEKARLQFSYVFKYSERPGTDCCLNMPDEIPVEVKKRRNVELLQLQEKISTEKNQSKIGQDFDVIVEGVSKLDDRRQFGRTNQFQIVVWESGDHKIGDVVRVRIKDATSLVLIADLVN